MKTRFSARPLAGFSYPLAAAVLAGVATAQGQSIDLSGWQSVQYELGSQPDASWDLQPGNTAVLQSVNSDASLFLSDFDAAGQEIRGTWRVNPVGDDDFMGFVFGYQDRGHYYLFDWKRGSQDFIGHFAEAGMSLKIVDMPPGTDPGQPDLWPTAGSPNVTVPLHNTIPWAHSTDYEFVLGFFPGAIEITVLEGGTVLENWTLADSTYTNGLFGFYNYSQGSVLYEGFTQQDVITLYCDAKANSLGCLPVLETTGAASISDMAPFEIKATNVINRKSGMLFFGRSGRAATPFFGGTLCVQPALQRLPILNSGGPAGAPNCSGTLTFDFNAWLQGPGAGSVMAGDQLNAQYFYRDPQHPDGTGYGLTGGVEFTVLP